MLRKLSVFGLETAAPEEVDMASDEVALPMQGAGVITCESSVARIPRAQRCANGSALLRRLLKVGYLSVVFGNTMDMICLPSLLKSGKLRGELHATVCQGC